MEYRCACLPAIYAVRLLKVMRLDGNRVILVGGKRDHPSFVGMARRASLRFGIVPEIIIWSRAGTGFRGPDIRIFLIVPNVPARVCEKGTTGDLCLLGS